MFINPELLRKALNAVTANKPESDGTFRIEGNPNQIVVRLDTFERNLKNFEGCCMPAGTFTHDGVQYIMLMK